MGMYERQLLGYDGKLLTIGGKLLRLFATGLYSFDEVNTLVYTQNYVPVATAAELHALRTTTSQTMGAGTVWEGTYTTGLDKKYIQVQHLDLVAYANWTPIGVKNVTAFTGTYDGNELNILNLTNSQNLSDKGLFSQTIGGTLKNINIVDANFSGTGAIQGLLCANAVTSSFVLNCHCSGSITNSGTGKLTLGGLIGINGIESYNLGSVIESCTSNTTITTSGDYIGGLVGTNTGNNAIIKKCTSFGSVVMSSGFIGGGLVGRSEGSSVTEDSKSYTNVLVTSTASDKTVSAVGGFAGTNNASAIIRRCSCYGDVTVQRTGNSARGAGGFVGYANTSAVVQNSYSYSDVTNAGTHTGGFIGWNEAVFTNCYAIGVVTSAGDTGGFAGVSSGTITNCYYNSQTSGQSDTGKGNPRTTIQMKEGTASSFILPAGGTDPDSLAANAMYTGWDDVDTWDFGTTSDYPELK